MNCFHYTPGHLSLSRTNLSWQKNNSWPSPHISLLSTLSLLKNWGWCFLRLLLVQHFHQTIHRSPRAEYLPPCESVRFASIWTSITGPIFPSNFSSDISDFFLKTEYLKNQFFTTFLIEKWLILACSAAGSALHSHCRGRRFESDQVHHF